MLTISILRRIACLYLVIALLGFVKLSISEHHNHAQSAKTRFGAHDNGILLAAATDTIDATPKKQDDTELKNKVKEHCKDFKEKSERKQCVMTYSKQLHDEETQQKIAREKAENSAKAADSVAAQQAAPETNATNTASTGNKAVEAAKPNETEMEKRNRAQKEKERRNPQNKQKIEYIQPLDEGTILNEGSAKFKVKKHTSFKSRNYFHVRPDIQPKYFMSPSKIDYLDDNFQVVKTIAPPNAMILAVSNDGEYYSVLSTDTHRFSTHGKNGDLLYQSPNVEQDIPAINIADDGSFAEKIGELPRSCLTFYDKAGVKLNSYYCNDEDKTHAIYGPIFLDAQNVWVFLSYVFHRGSDATELFVNTADTGGNLLWRQNIINNDGREQPMLRDIGLFFSNNGEYILSGICYGKVKETKCDYYLLNKHGNISFSLYGSEMIDIRQFELNNGIVKIFGDDGYFAFDATSKNLISKSSFISEGATVSFSSTFLNDMYVAVSTQRSQTWNRLMTFDTTGNKMTEYRVQKECSKIFPAKDREGFWLDCGDKVIKFEIVK